MPLNIKDPEAHALARALQRETGATMTRAVTEALREQLQRVRRRWKSRANAEELVEIGRRCAGNLKGAVVDHATQLYDQRGLPR